MELWHLPVILGGIYEIVDFGIDEFEDALFRRLLITPETLGRVQCNGLTGGGG